MDMTIAIPVRMADPAKAPYNRGMTERGDRIRQARRAMRLSQEELAGRMDVTQPLVSQWEHGRKALSADQLKTLADQDSDNSLLKAGIEQKIAALKPVPFSSAIDLRQNRKYLTYAIPPIAVVLILLFAAPSILTKPTERLIKHGQIVPEEAPFKIQLLNESLRLPENADITIDILVKGNEIPDKVYVVVEDQQFMLEKKDNLHFSYTFKNVRENQEFNFYASGFYSETYELEVMPVPALADFKAALKYPAYTKRVNEEVKNTGDLTVPVGTKISWEF